MRDCDFLREGRLAASRKLSRKIDMTPRFVGRGTEGIEEVVADVLDPRGAETKQRRMLPGNSESWH